MSASARSRRGARFVDLVLVEQQRAVMHMDLVAARLDRERATQKLGRFVEPLEILERQRRDCRASSGSLRLERQRLAIDGLGLVGALQFAQAGAEIVPGVGEVRLQFDGAAIGLLGVRETLEALQRIAAIAVRLGEIVLQRDGAIVDG